MQQLRPCKVILSLVVLVSILTAGTCFSQTSHQVSEEALRIHNSAILFDGHNDLPWQIRKLGGGSFETYDISKLQPKLQTDIPKLKQSGLKAQFWSVYVSADTLDTNDSLLRTLEQIQIVQKMYRKYPETFERANTSVDIERIIKQGKIASMMGVEGGHSIEGSLQMLKRFYDEGVRYMTLTHNRSLDWAGSCNGDPKQGLSPFGEEVISEMNRLGMLVDLSHVSLQTMRDTFQITKAPVIFSHSSARAICEHPRNVSDEILRLLPENGGVVMVNFYSGFIVPTELLAKDKNTLGELNMVIDHIDHIVRVAGIDHVGIGSDFDGVSRLPKGLEDVSCYPAITQELLNRGYSKGRIHKILGGNILRVLQQAELVSQRLKSQNE